ncbi:MAG: tetratricopeptide repeat protein [Bacillota bacterium]
MKKDMNKVTNIEDFMEDKSAQAKSYKIGRNEPCPCGSGKKYKKCCAQVTPEKSKEYYKEKIKEENDAEKVFNLLLEADEDYPVDPDFTLPIAVYSLQNKEGDKAREYLHKAWRIMKEDLDDVFIMPLVNLLLQSGNLEEASEIAEKALNKKGDSPQLLIAKGEVLKARGEFEKAFDLIERGLEIEPNNIELVIFKIETLLDVNNLVAAMEVLNSRFDNLMPLVETDQVYALSFLKKLLVENFSMPEDAGKEEMKAVLEQAIEVNHLWNDAYEKLGHDKKEEAVEKLDEIKELVPEDSELIINLVHDYYVAGNYNRVLETATKSEKYFEENPDFNHMIGLALMEKGEYKEAKPHLDYAHELAHGPKYDTQSDKWSISGDYIRYFLEMDDNEGLMEVIRDIDSLISDKETLISTLMQCLDGYPLEKYPMQLLLALKENKDDPLINSKELYITYLNTLLTMLDNAEKQSPESAKEMKKYLKNELININFEEMKSPILELSLLRVKEDDLKESELMKRYEKLMKLPCEFPEEYIAKYEAVLRYGEPAKLLDDPPETGEMSKDYFDFYKLVAAIKSERIEDVKRLFNKVGYSEIKKGNSTNLFLKLLNYIDNDKMIKVFESFKVGEQFVSLIKEIVNYFESNNKK